MSRSGDTAMEQSMNEPVRVGVVGMGTVGSGVVRVLGQSADHIGRQAGRPIVVEQVVVRDIGKSTAAEVLSVMEELARI